MPNFGQYHTIAGFLWSFSKETITMPSQNMYDKLILNSKQTADFEKVLKVNMNVARFARIRI